MNKRKRNDDELTEREIEVLNLISKKMNDYEIGEKLCISHHTAHSHRKKSIKSLQLTVTWKPYWLGLNAVI